MPRGATSPAGRGRATVPGGATSPAGRPALGPAGSGAGRRGSSSGVASSRTPARPMAVRGPSTPPSTPHRAVSSAVDALAVTDQADRARTTRSAGRRSRRQVAQTGLKTPQQRISASSTPITSSSPPVPGPRKARPTGHRARSAPEPTRTRCDPNRVTSGRASRDPSSPPTEGAAKASPYCHGANPSGPSISTASSGWVAITRPLKTAVLRNSGRSTGSARRYRQPSSSSPARIRAAGRGRGRGSRPSVARMPRAESR
ncbi:hypothetical protein SFUMM280S_09189 [Streptomyces fumanus]